MKKIFKNIKIIGLSIATVLLGLGGYYFKENYCKLDGTNVCYDNKKGTFKIEDDVTLKVQVENEALGKYLVKVWDETHPDQFGALEPVVKKPLTILELADDFQTDIIVTSQNNGAYVLNETLDLGKEVSKRILSKVPSTMQDAINIKGTHFIQNSIKGWTFVYNKTLAQELGIDLIDNDIDGLPDAFNSWEKIFEMEDKLLEKVEYVFPLTFVDQLSFYPFLTGGKWRLNFSNKGNEPGFDTPEFLKGLSLVEDFGNSRLTNSETKKKANELSWEYESALINRKSLFSIVGDWMQLDYFLGGSTDEFVIAPFPTYQNHYLAPMGYVDGYMVDKNVKYPSASAEVLRILRSPEAATYYKSTDGKVFIYHRDNIEDLEVSDSLKNKIRALNYNDTEPVFVLEDHPNVLARSLYSEVDFMPILRDLFDGKITTEQAQEQFVTKAIEWKEGLAPLNNGEE